MSEEIQTQAVNESVATPDNVEPTPSSEQPTEVSESTTEAATEVTSESVAKEEQVASPAENVKNEKPTRSERRIRDLVNKNKAMTEELSKLNPSTSVENPLDGGTAVEPLITPEEMAEGIDPAELERRMDIRTQRTVQNALRQRDQMEAFTTTVNTHVSDLESTVASHPELDSESDSYDPAMEKALLRRYEDANYNDKGQFSPKRKASEILSELMEFKQASVAKETAKISGTLAQQADESALAPSTSQAAAPDYEEAEAFEKARKSGSDDDWAKVLKSRI